jgi:hypothetical protein
MMVLKFITRAWFEHREAFEVARAAPSLLPAKAWHPRVEPLIC